MTGWNMPPGCNVSDIPGNRPEDLAAEALAEKIAEKLVNIPGYTDISASIQEAIEEATYELCNEAYGEGYRTAQADESMAHDAEQQAMDKLKGELLARIRVITAMLEGAIHG